MFLSWLPADCRKLTFSHFIYQYLYYKTNLTACFILRNIHHSVFVEYGEKERTWNENLSKYVLNLNSFNVVFRTYLRIFLTNKIKCSRFRFSSSTLKAKKVSFKGTLKEVRTGYRFTPNLLANNISIMLSR